MIWYVCAAAALVFLVLAGRTALSGRFGSARVSLVLAWLSAATFVVYIPIFFQLYDAAAALFCNIINVFQVISLDADYGAFYDMVHQQLAFPLAAGGYMVLLGALHFLMPVVSLLAVYNILLLCYSSMQMLLVNLRRRPLYVFSAQNDSALALARDIRRGGRRCDVVFAGCSEEDRRRDELAGQGFVFHPSPLQKIDVERRRGKRVCYFCISEDEDANLSDALFLLQRCAGQPKQVQRDTQVILFTQQANADMMIDSTDKGFVDVKLVNRSESAAYQLITRYPLYRYARDRRISVLLCGFGPVNRALLKAIAWCGVLEGYELALCVAGVGIREGIDDFFDQCPELGETLPIEFIDAGTRAELDRELLRRCPDAGYLVVDAGGDEGNLDQAVRLRRLYYGVGGGYDNCPAIFLHVEDPEKYAMVANLRTSETNPAKRVGYGLVPFGETGALDTLQDLTASELDLLAKNIHLEYEDIFSDGGIDVMDALERYNLLEVNKRSNRAAALHIRYKLALLGLDYTLDEDAREVDLEQYLTPENLELLTRAEHMRWMRFLQTEGWSTATVEEVRAYQRTGVSAGKHNCQLLKKHPYICDFDELQDRSEALGLPDSTTYDRELILRIPNILHDKWNVSGKRYKIVRQKDKEE